MERLEIFIEVDNSTLEWKFDILPMYNDDTWKNLWFVDLLRSEALYHSQAICQVSCEVVLSEF